MFTSGTLSPWLCPKPCAFRNHSRLCLCAGMPLAIYTRTRPGHPGATPEHTCRLRGTWALSTVWSAVLECYGGEVARMTVEGAGAASETHRRPIPILMRAGPVGCSHDALGQG